METLKLCHSSVINVKFRQIITKTDLRKIPKAQLEYEVFHPSLLWSLPWHFLVARTRPHLSLVEKNIEVTKHCQQQFTKAMNFKLKTCIYLAYHYFGCFTQTHHIIICSNASLSQCYLINIPSCSSQTYLCFQRHYELEQPLYCHLTAGEQLRGSVLCTGMISSSSLFF